MVCERMTIISSSLFYCFSVQSSAIYLPHELYIAKETVSSCHLITPSYLPTSKQLQIGGEVRDCASSTSPDFGEIWNGHFSANIPLINRMSALRCQNRISQGFET